MYKNIDILHGLILHLNVFRGPILKRVGIPTRYIYIYIYISYILQYLFTLLNIVSSLLQLRTTRNHVDIITLIFYG